jgi:hypothetical protein
MAFALIMTWDSGFDPDAYREISRRAGTEDRPADGCLSHFVGLADGRGYIAEVWESQQKADAFMAQTGPLLGEVGFPPPSSVTAFETLKFTRA